MYTIPGLIPESRDFCCFSIPRLKFLSGIGFPNRHMTKISNTFLKALTDSLKIQGLGVLVTRNRVRNILFWFAYLDNIGNQIGIQLLILNPIQLQSNIFTYIDQAYQVSIFWVLGCEYGVRVSSQSHHCHYNTYIQLLVTQLRLRGNINFRILTGNSLSSRLFNEHLCCFLNLDLPVPTCLIIPSHTCWP